MRAWSLLFYAFALWFASPATYDAATGHMRTTALGRVLYPLALLTFLLCAHAITVYTWKRRRIRPPPELLREREERAYLLSSPRPAEVDWAGLWWWNRLALLAFLAMVGEMLVLVVLGRLGLL